MLHMIANIDASPSPGWSIELVGWPLWLVAPLAVVAAWMLVRLARYEVALLPSRVRRAVLGLRAAVCGLLVIMLVQPTCQNLAIDRIEPRVQVLIDRSGSMAVRDIAMHAYHRLNEAVALGLIPKDLRNTDARDAAETLRDLQGDLPTIRQALAGLVSDAPSSATSERRSRARTLARQHADAVTAAADALDGQQPLSSDLRALAELFDRIAERIDLRQSEHRTRSIPSADALREATAETSEDLRTLIRRCLDVQKQNDEALVAAAADIDDSPIRRGLAAFDTLSRIERASRLFERQIKPEFEGRVQFSVAELNETLTPLNPAEFIGAETMPAESTDPAAQAGQRAQAVDLGSVLGNTNMHAPLTHLIRHRDENRADIVLMLTDGRQTEGADPLAHVRRLHDNGTRVAGVLVGNPDQPRDAVIADITGNTEVFKNETIVLTVKFRITGYGEQPFDLIMTRRDEELERRAVVGSGQWQFEQFEFPAEDADDFDITARLEPSRNAAIAATEEAAITVERWTRIKGDNLSELTRHRPYRRNQPDATATIQTLSFSANEDDYGTRIRGFLVPPISGTYTFWISGDDECQLWLSTDASSRNRVQVASVPDYTEKGEWSKFETQTSEPIELRAGARYFVEVLHKEGSGGDHVAVGWQMPDGTMERPIPASRVIPYDVDLERADRAVAGGNDEESLKPEASLDNNTASVRVVVNEDPMRVLLLDADPRWDSRYLASMLERDGRVELTRRYLNIRTELRRVGQLPKDEPLLMPHDREELERYDMVVLGDLTPAELAVESQQWLADFVARRGGFLVVLAGPRAMPSGFALSSLADALPVRPLSSAPRELASNADRGDAKPAPRFGLQLTETGADTPITAVLNDRDLNRQLWPALPRLVWIATGMTAKPGAKVLLTADDEAATPLVVTHQYGAGRVFYMGTDETFRWRDRLGDRIHQTFWLQVQRWGMEGRLRGSDERLKAALDRKRIEPDETVLIRARAQLKDGTPIETPLTATVEPLDDDNEPIAARARRFQMAPEQGTSHIWRQVLGDLPEGRYRITVTCNDPEHPELADLLEVRELTVQRRAGDEGLDLSADLAHLDRLSRAGGHRAATFDAADESLRELIDSLEVRTEINRTTLSLWNNYWLITLISALLLIEWLLRRRHGLP